jgi:hypothetical protein
MQWRRGLLLAGIHLVVAGTLIIQMEARDAQSVRNREESTAEAAREAALRPQAPVDAESGKADTEQDSETFVIDPCSMWVHYPVQQSVVVFANLPAFVLTGWRDVCPPHWSLAGMLHTGGWLAQTAPKVAAQKLVDLGLGAIIAIQWFLVGGFPLIRSRRLWGEPGMFITICAVPAFGLAMIPAVDELALFPALLAFFAWLWWFGLLVWVGLRSGWRLVRRKRRRG